MKNEEPSFKQDKKSGKTTINLNGHVCNFDDDEYHSLLRGSNSNFSAGRCYLCGERINFLLTTDYVNKTHHIETVSFNYVDHRRVNNTNICSMSDHKKQENPYEIKVKSGNFIIANYFLTDNGEYSFDVPEKEKYEDKYSLASIQGQNNRANYISDKYDVAYCQVNTELEVWVSNAGDKVFLVDAPWFGNKAKGRKKDQTFNKEFVKDKKFIKKLSQSVWRWEGADKSIVKKHNAIPVSSVELEIEKGTYRIKHHYGKMYFSMGGSNYTIVSEIEKVKNKREVLTEKNK